jgi:hypothetical protein
MIRRIGLGVELLLISLLMGCCPNGCFVIHGDAYEKLAHPKPYIELWEKAGASEGQRAIDWLECGGASNGDFSPAIARLKEEKRPEESGRDAAYFRLQQKLKHCMVAKDYRYMGKIRVTPEP